MQDAPYPTKRCSKCERHLPLDAFSKDKRKADGLRYGCRECDRAYRQQRHWAEGLTPEQIQIKRDRAREWVRRNRDSDRAREIGYAFWIEDKHGEYLTHVLGYNWREVVENIEALDA